jgi:hypothetical protein
VFDCPYDAENDIDSDGICGDVDAYPYCAENYYDCDDVCGGDGICEVTLSIGIGAGWNWFSLKQQGLISILMVQRYLEIQLVTMFRQTADFS